MAAALARGPYVGGGLGSAFGGAPAWPGVVAIVVSVGAAVVAHEPAAVPALVIAGLLVVALARARLGGVTGDVLGAAGIVGETVALVVATASW
jgi:adenosylcobinamide-GDP ribazoletransferase